MSGDDGKIVRFEHTTWQEGFTVFPNVILLNARLSFGARMAWATLAYYARQSDEAWPGQERLAVSMGISDRTVRSYLRELEEAGLLTTRRRGSISNLYTLNAPSQAYLDDFHRQRPSIGPVLPVEAPIGSSAPVTIGSEAPVTTGSQLPTKKTQVEEDTGEEGTAEAGTSPAAGDQLFEAPAEATTADPLDAQAEDIWTHYATVFGDRLRVKELTPPRRRTLRKALGAVAGDVQLCKRAIDGLQSYRKKNPQGSQDVSLSVVFETGPQSRSSLTDQIEWWASQADARTTGAGLKVPLDLSGVPSVSAGTIRVRREWARRKFEEPDNEYVQQQGEAALTWLREHCGHAPVFTDGRITGWRAVEA